MRIVVLDGFTLNPGDLDWTELHKLGDVTIYDRTEHEQIVERAKGAEILLTNKTPLNASTLNRLPDVKYIGVLATGYDVVDLQAATERKIVVTNIPAYSTDSVAQFTFALLLELCHRVSRHSEEVHRGEWSRSKDFSFWLHPQLELANKTIGIVGYGTIGAKVAQIAHAFGMNVLAYKRNPLDTVPFSSFEWSDFDHLLRTADVVSLHCPLTPETEEMINRNTLSLMKQSAFLINTARGKLINEQDLATALQEERIAGAGLDVLSAEPPAKDHPLLQTKNCLITPHIAWATREARGRLMKIAIQNIQAYLSGRTTNQVNA